MAQIREIKKRMIAVGTIQRITKTMQMIATAKFTAAVQRAKATQPYTDKIRELVSAVCRDPSEIDHPLVGGEKKSGRELVLIISSDRGLCGAYNGHVFRTAKNLIKNGSQQGHEMLVESSGKKATAFLKFEKIPSSEHHEVGDKPDFDQVSAMADKYMEMFTSGEVDSVKVVYMRFESTARQNPEVMQLLPMDPPKAEQAEGESGGINVSYEFTPDEKSLLDELLPRAVRTSLFQAYNDSVVSEQVMRMVAMKAATDNAAGLGRTLKRDFNRARQAKITTELTEIVSGAAALE